VNPATRDPRPATRYWLPAIAWTLLVLAASTDLLSSANTAVVFGPLNFVVRKLAHFIEYGIAAALYFRALRGGRAGWRWSWAVVAVAMACAVASLDEWHQTFTATRTGTPADVALDTAGAAIGQCIVRLWC